MSLTTSERAIFLQTLKLASAVAQGELSALGAKECLRARIESERRELEQIDGQFPTVFDWDRILLKMALATHALDGMKPREAQGHRDWTPEAGALFKSLQKLEGKRAPKDSNEARLYLLWSITQAVIMADAATVLDEWQTQNAEAARKNEKLNRLESDISRLRQKRRNS